MLVRLFRGTGPGLVLLILLAAAALWAGTWLNPASVDMAPVIGSMPLWNVVLQLSPSSAEARIVISFVLMLLMSLVLIRFNISEFFINRRTFFPGLLYIMIYSVFQRYMVFNPALPTALLITIALWRMIVSYRQNGVAYNFFDAALMISSAGLFYADALWFLALVFIGTLLLRSPDLREIFVALIGALLPWVFLYAIWYLTGKNLADLNTLIINNLFEKAAPVLWSRTFIILLCALGLNLLISLYVVFADMTTKKVKSRKTFAMLLWLFAISAAVFFFVPSASAEIVAIAAIPAVFVISDYYVFARKLLMPEILFALMVIMIVIARIWI
jgi:hypothetical protein